MPIKNLLLLTLHAKDGYPLAATHYPADSEQFIVIASATGVPRGFYRRFAEFAQARGINVITTDYPGIGDSKPSTLKGYANAPVEAIDLQPASLGVQQVGHMGYFRQQTGQVLWPQIFTWLGRHGQVQNNV
jgi:predicted alpha/beta hydrolase